MYCLEPELAQAEHKRTGGASHRFAGEAFGWALAVLLVLTMCGSTARADVIEIGLDGAAVTYAKPAIYTDAGMQPIRPPDVAGPTQSRDVRQALLDAAQRHNLNPDLVTAVAWRESGFRQTAVSNRDAVGVMQLTAGTARDLGVDRYDLRQNIHGGTAYLRAMLDRYGGDVRLALAAYNAGPGAVDRFRGVPPFAETAAYVTAILAKLPPRPPPNAAFAIAGR